MTKSADVLVIGGGIIGLAVTDRLAREGLAVTLLERGTCGQESSWASLGLLKPSNPNRRGAVQQFQRVALERMPGFCADLAERTGIDPEYDCCESIELLFDDQRYRMALSEECAARQMPDGLPEWQVLNPQEARELEPCIAEDCLAALLCRFTAQVRNPRLLRALAESCRSGGARLEENTPARGLEFDQDRVSGVVTDSGRLEAKQVVLCAGAWSSQLDPRLEEIMPVYPVRGQAILLDVSGCPELRLKRVVDRKKGYVIPRRDPVVVVGTTLEPEVGFERRNTPTATNELLGKALSLVPGLASADVAALWSGFRPGTPDRRPYLGRIPGLGGLLAATGHYRTGVALAPITAEVVADLIIRGESPQDLGFCRPGRPLDHP